ncbi:alpha/beta fold hydrolase [Paenibacillus piri]|uniref:Alpha/beta fold hydrolase n=2 Tax=Paenibacillus piri TaxID=2547395 RepID=A0A4R5KXC6_9BACL|nr:alpha/beta fold hydrolase [Paenibacillus piri]
MLHGFTGGPYELTPLAEHLSKRGTVCHVPELPGHDPELLTLGQVQWDDWLSAASEAADDLTRRYGAIDLIGFSMGGLLSAYIANRFPVRKLVLLNAAVYYPSPLRLIKDVARRARSNDWYKWNGKMKKTPWKATLQFIALNKRMRHEIPHVTVPTYIAQGEQDHIIHPKSARFLYSQLRGEKELHLFRDTRHMICLEAEAPELFDSVERFLYKHDER